MIGQDLHSERNDTGDLNRRKVLGLTTIGGVMSVAGPAMWSSKTTLAQESTRAGGRIA